VAWAEPGALSPRGRGGTSLAHALRGGPLTNARLVAWDGARVTCLPRARWEEAAGRSASPQRITLAVAAFLQRWLQPVPRPQSRGVRASGLYHPTQTAARALSRTALGQPPVVLPVWLAWQTVCAQRGDAHPERCPACGQTLVGTAVIPRGGAPPRLASEACAA
jgi:Putative transposase